MSDTSNLTGLDVEVYYNLHKHTFSIRDRKTRIVVGHADYVQLRNVTFHVSEAGRQRVLRERRKNVHAFVRGTVMDITDPWWGEWGDSNGECGYASYNPYKGGRFIDVWADDAPLAGAGAAVLAYKEVLVYDPIYLDNTASV